MSKNVGLYAFQSPEAQLLADLSVVGEGLKRTLAMLTPLRLGDTFQNFGVDQTEAYWTTSVIRYSRLFNPGVLRWDARGALDQLEQAEVQTHKRIMDLRNGYIAHSVGDYELPVPVVQIRSREDGSLTVDAVLCCQSRIAGPSSFEVERFFALTLAVLRAVDVIIENERRRLLVIAERVGPNELVKAGLWSANPGQSPPRTPRPKIG